MKFFIKTFGCQMNWADTERLKQYLIKHKLQPVMDKEQADLVIVNLCSVRESAVEKANQYIKSLPTRSREAKVILIGCILKRDQARFREEVDLLIPTKEFTLKGKLKPNLFWQKLQKILGSQFKKETILSSRRENSQRGERVAYLPIMRGCNNFCAYCVVPYTRGREESRPLEEIIKDFKDLIKKGTREIVLLGQNVNSYSSETEGKRVDFSQLLKSLNSIPGRFKISFLTNHPQDMTTKLIDTIAQCKKVKKYIHLPLQAGDNEILKKMGRGYTREDYLALVQEIKRKIPHCIITTDIIVGFPGETREKFQKTVDLVERIDFQQIYIGKYSPRPGTAAYQLGDEVSWEEKKRRERVLREIMQDKKAA